MYCCREETHRKMGNDESRFELEVSMIKMVKTMWHIACWLYLIAGRLTSDKFITQFQFRHVRDLRDLKSPRAICYPDNVVVVVAHLREGVTESFAACAGSDWRRVEMSTCWRRDDVPLHGSWTSRLLVPPQKGDSSRTTIHCAIHTSHGAPDTDNDVTVTRWQLTSLFVSVVQLSVQ